MEDPEDITEDSLARLIERWRRGETSDPEGELAFVVTRLLEYYAPASVPDWLLGNSPDLGGRRPIDVLRAGGLAEVIAAIDAQTSGSFL